MTDLEEKFLKKNVPGKYSQWEREEEEDSNDEDSYNCEAIQPSQHKKEIYYGNGKGGANTGVKGVLSDYRQSKQLQFIERERERQASNSIGPCQMKMGEVSFSLESIEKRRLLEKRGTHSPPNTEDDSESDEDFDSEFLNSYRKQRMTEMRNQAANWPVFGELIEVGSFQQFSKFIDETDARASCVFHLYDERILPCNIMNEHFENLASRMKFARFFRMKISLIKPNFDPIGLPCVLIYRGGSEVANLTPITKSFHNSNRNRFTSEEVEQVLICHGLTIPT